MKYNNQNVAYNHYDLNSINQKKLNLKLVKTKQVTILKMAPLRAFVLLFFSMFMLSYLIYSKVSLDKIGNEIIQYQEKYETALNEKVRLEVGLESKISLKNIEEIAKKQGLMPIQDYQVEYVDFEVQDNIKLINNKDGIVYKIMKIFNGVLAYIK